MMAAPRKRCIHCSRAEARQKGPMSDEQPKAPPGPDWHSHSVSAIGLLPTAFGTMLTALIAGCAYLLIEKSPSTYAAAFLGAAIVLACIGLGCTLLYLLTFSQTTSILASANEEPRVEVRAVLARHLARAKLNSQRAHIGQVIFLILAFVNAAIGVAIASHVPIFGLGTVLAVNLIIVFFAGKALGRVAR